MHCERKQTNKQLPKNMVQSMKVLLPTFPTENIVYFKGNICILEHQEGQELIIYVTDYSTTYRDLSQKLDDDESTLYGYCSKIPVNDKHLNNSKNTFVLEKQESFRIKTIVLHGRRIRHPEDCIIMLYDHKQFKSSETVGDLADHFSILQGFLKKDFAVQPSSHEPYLKTPQWLSSSMFVQHLINYFNVIGWLITTIIQERKVSIKLGNFILAILTDVALGYINLSQFQFQDKKILQLMSILEILVNMMYSLLKWLMGSPAGLKLNNAFNKMLGQYFSYHIKLWWLFLDATAEELVTILPLYHYFGYIGLTFQAAIVSDLISVVMFHSYCIYIYAARLFNIQVSGLIALLRLFVGRKYNPLRGGIDSCEYTNQELFVGTLAFTILLLLLPTTTMYYIVFTLFRLLSLGLQYILAKLIYIMHTLPLYVTSLWLVRSPKVAGNILLELENNDEGAPLVLRVKLFSKSLQELVQDSKPPVKVPMHFEWTNVFSKVIRGNII